MGMYRIENRHQDEWWEPAGYETDDVLDAADRADAMRKQAMIYGMVRIVDCETGQEVDVRAVMGTFLDRLRRGLNFDN